jgi:F-type H+-transporting ATPase subunit gamma|eukprot:Macronucleus_940.p1 GENE.Macronucleus_940~~Macronucleus_940.p1  ORF type:complete len:307 (+),score=122.24 Macronucleus_940:1-921(+)
MCANPLFSRNALATSQLIVPTQQRFFAVSEKELKQRMKSVNNIRKITKAMKMVATSKMKQDMVRLEAGKHFGVNGVNMMFTADTYMKDRAPNASADPAELLVPITSDKGMCGSINSGIIRSVRAYVDQHGRAKKTIFSIGDKGTVGLKRPCADLLKVGISEVSTPYNYPTVMALSEHIIKSSEGCDKVTVFYNEYKSAISQIVRSLDIMPRQRFLDTLKFGKTYDMSLPDKNTANPALYELYVTSNLWVAFLHNAASEQSARMNAMENASKNAGEILEKLTLIYNKARQARITMELVEIISGASAL